MARLTSCIILEVEGFISHGHTVRRLLLLEGNIEGKGSCVHTRKFMPKTFHDV